MQPIATTINSSIFQKTVWNNTETEEQKQHRLENLNIALNKYNEYEQRQQKLQQSKMLKKSGIPKIYMTKTIPDFTITNQNSDATYALNHPDKSYYIFGDCGTGKTFLASLLIKLIVTNNHQPYFFTTTELIFLLNPYKPAERPADEPQPITRHQIYNCHSLVIDDLGVEKPAPLNNSILFDLVNHRYNEELQTIFTSNFNIKDLQKRLGSYEGGRLGRRIVSMCKPIFLKNII